MSANVTDWLQQAGLILIAVMGVALLLALLLALLIHRQVKKIDVPPGAGFTETLLHTPFLVVVTIDLLDLALDFLAAPIAWVILDRWGLKALRNVSAVEALIPFTQAIPTLTLAWLYTRFFGGAALRERID